MSLLMPMYQVFVKTDLSLERKVIPEHFTTMDEVRKFIEDELQTTMDEDELYRLAFTGLAIGEYDNGMLSTEAEIKLCLVGTDAPLV